MIIHVEKARKIKNFFKNEVFFLKGVLLLVKLCLNLNRRINCCRSWTIFVFTEYY